MADIDTFPTIQEVLYAGDNIQTFTAGEAIKAGQVVGIAAAGVSMTVVVMNATSGETAIGVALYDVSSEGTVAVAMNGCIVYVANADDTTAIDAGDRLAQNDNAVGGTVSAASATSVSIDAGATAVTSTAANGAITTVAGGYLPQQIVGIALDDIAGNSTGRMLVACN